MSDTLMAAPSRSTRVLIVDDEAALRKVLHTSLVNSGFVVEEAENGNVAVSVFRDHRFDLVLLDSYMPGITGVAACRQIRELDPGTGIVMVTVRDSEEDKVNALEAGADDYITLPAKGADRTPTGCAATYAEAARFRIRCPTSRRLTTGCGPTCPLERH